MKMLKYAAIVALVAMVVAACATEPAAQAEPAAEPAAEESAEMAKSEPVVGMPGEQAEGLEPTTFVYMHQEGSGAQAPTLGHILFENQTLEYVQYQIGYTSCLCRPQDENVRSLLYIEIANDGTINNVRFDYWGESDPIPWTGGYGHEQFKEDYVEPAVGMTNEEVQAMDSVSGATVSVANFRTVIDGIMAYHENNYM
jgi:major membrane immunogen (membrane-anchored lipoprotein)